MDAKVPVRMAGVLRAVLHPLHLRHHRQAQGRAARHRRLRRGAGRVDEAHLLRRRGRDHVLHLGHRLGGRPLLHHLRPADRRHGHDHVRRHAAAPGCRHLVADRREVQGHGDVLGADRGARAEEAGPGLHAQVRPVVAALPVPGRRAARRADPRMDHDELQQAGHRQLLADRDRLADAVHLPGVEEAPIKLRLAELPGLRLRPAHLPRGRHRVRRQREGHRRHRAAAAAGLPVHRLGQDERFVSTYFTLFKEPLVYSSFDWGIKDDDGYFHHPRPHRRRDQRRRPPPGHPRDRGSDPGPPGDRRSGRGRRGRQAQGPDADGLRRGQGCRRSTPREASRRWRRKS
jgi:hypothetical protein